MGANQCKAVGVQPGIPLGSKQFDEIWKRYESKKSVAAEGVLSRKSALKLLNDLAKAAGVPQMPADAANRVVDDALGGAKDLRFESFKSLIKSFVQEQPRFQITQSLGVRIGEGDDDDIDASAPTQKPPTRPLQGEGKPQTNVPRPGAASSSQQQVIAPLPPTWKRNVPKAQTSVRLIEETIVIAEPRYFELTFGEDTSLPIDVLEAHFFFDVMPFLNAALVNIEFVVTNTAVPGREIQAKLRLPLNTGAVVSRFAFEAVAGTLVDGVVLPKKKAAAVEYLEKEKGRNVGTTKKVEGDLFETTLFPLPHNQKRRMVVSYLTQLEQLEDGNGAKLWSYAVPFSFSKPLDTFTAGFNVAPESLAGEVRVSAPTEQKNATLSTGFQIQGDVPPVPSAGSLFAVGESDGRMHFSTFIPLELIDSQIGKEAPSASEQKKEWKVAVIWDRSVSMEKAAPTNIKAIEEIQNARASKGQTVTYDLFFFNTTSNRAAQSINIETLLQKLNEVFYDGGTDLSTLDECLEHLQQGNFDHILLFSDGLDNIGHAKRLPRIANDLKIPVHVFGPAVGNSNSQLLQTIASRTGGVFENASKVQSALSAIVDGNPATYITGLEIQEVAAGSGSLEDLFCDETFQTVPDWKLSNSAWEVSPTRGAYVTGTMKSRLLKKIEIIGRRGSKEFRIPLDFERDGAVEVLGDGAGRLLALIHCQQAMTEGRVLHIDPAFSSHYLQELAIRYRIVSEQTSLLFLLTADQFIDNEIDCPENHPAFEDWKSRKAAITSPKEPKEVTEMAKATGSQVKSLASVLKDVLSKPAPAFKPSTASTSQSSLVDTISVGVPLVPPPPMPCPAPGGAPPPPMCFLSESAACPPPPLACVALPPPACAAPPPARSAMPAPVLERAAPRASTRTCIAPRERKSRRRQSPEIPTRDCVADALEDMHEMIDDCSLDESEADMELSRMISEERSKEKCADSSSSAAAPTIAADPSQYLPEIEARIKGIANDTEKVIELYRKYRVGANQASPSFYFNTSRLFLEAGVDKKLCVQVLTNALELNVQDVQMFRSAGYFMFQLDFLPQAIQLFEQVMELAPEEPQSFLDLSLAHYIHVRRQKEQNPEKPVDAQELTKAIDLAVTVLRRTWQPRFAEIEYSALVWINWMVGYGKHHGLTGFYPSFLEKGLLVEKFTAALLVSMGWDTDHVDIDLHVSEPDGYHVYYGAKDSPLGGHLSKDFTQGYGPEVYLIKNYVPGPYKVWVRYFASHQDSASTGATSAVVWKVENIGDWEKEKVLFRCVRLTVGQSEHDILQFNL